MPFIIQFANPSLVNIGRFIEGPCVTTSPVPFLSSEPSVSFTKFLEVRQSTLAATPPSSPQTIPKMWHPTKLALGAFVIAGFVTYYAALETSCAKMSTRGDGGELVITSGGTAEGIQAGLRMPAPRFAWSGEMPLNGTAEARLLRIDNLCDDVLVCSSCPPQLHHGIPQYDVRSAFNASVFDGALLITNPGMDNRLFCCGENRMARALGRTGLAGIASAYEGNPWFTPGAFRKVHRIGEHRDALSRDGDAGIPFPAIHATQFAFNPIIEALGNGAQIRAVVTPTTPNPWHSTMCGYWKPLQTILMLGHTWVAERAASCFVGHVRSAGARCDLAQTASVTEVMAHLLLALAPHDPFVSFHWGLLPVGVFPAALICPLVLTCSSTLLLAGFWCVSQRSLPI